MNGVCQPERPRLRKGIKWFDSGDGLVIRSAKGSFEVPATLRDVAERLLTSLNGQRDIGQLVSGFAPLDGLSAIGLLSSFAKLDVVVDDAIGSQASARVAGNGSWPNASVAVLGAGLLSDAIRDRLKQSGARLDTDEASFSVLAPQGPDFRAFDNMNRAAYDAGRTWMPVFPFGDVIIVGPLIRPRHTACFRCFELRWLGISPSGALERQYLNLLRQNRPKVEVNDHENAAHLAERIVPLLGRQARALEAPTTVWMLSLEEDTIHEARLETHPGCEVCGRDQFARTTGGPTDAGAWHEADRDLREVAANIAGLVDQYVGIAAVVPSPHDDNFDPASGLPAIVLSRYAVPQPDLLSSDQTNLAHGSGDSQESARTVALIEGLERYCGLFPPQPDIISSFADLNGTALLPTELPLFSTAQYAKPGFPYRPFEPEMTLGWTWGWNVSRGERILVPSAAVWYGAEDLLVAETSNGVAAHSSRDHALQNGVLELIERDAFMIHWLHRISPPRFDRRQLRGKTAVMVERIEQRGYTVVLADITTDLNVPVVLALGIHELQQRPALLVGAGASLDGATALRRAVRELYAAATGILENWELGAPLDADEVVDLKDHSRAYEHPDWLPKASFLWAGSVTKEPPLASPAEMSQPGLSALVDQLGRKGHDVIGVDISTPEVARCGIRVVRAIVPGLQPLAFGPRLRLGGRRLYDAPLRLDPARPAATEADLNHVPHCFP